MKKYLALVKLLFVQQYKARSTTARNGRRGKKSGFAVYIVLALCLLPILSSTAVGMYYFGQVSNGNVYVGTFLTLMCQGLVLMFGVHALISNVFVVKDADKLLYLPVRSYTIFLAKLTVAYINEIITTAVAILVLLLPFGIGASVGFQYYLMLPFALLLIPMLPLLVGALIAMPFSAIIARLSKNTAVRTALRILIYVLIMALYMYGMYSFGFLTGSENGNIFDNPEAFAKDIVGDFVERLAPVMPYFHPDYMLLKSMVATGFTDWIVGFAVALAENLALLALVFLVSLPFYRKMLSLSTEEGGATRRRGKEQYKLTSKGVTREFMLTDLKRTLRDSQLGFQSFVGIIMMPLIVVILYFSMGLSDDGDASFLNLMAVSPLYQVIAPLLILAYMTFIGLGTNVLGLYPISRENKSAYMLKSLPVPFSKILLAKVLLATAVMVISDFITCVLIVALLGVKWYYGIAILITMALLGFGSMCITTMFDLKNPHLGWTNFSHSLKNTKNSWIALLIGLLSVVAIAAVSALFVVWYAITSVWYAVLIMWIMVFGVSVAFAVVAYKIMAGKATKYFTAIEI